MRLIGFIALALGVIGILMSLPLLGFAALGYLGILADMSISENHSLGMQLLYLGLPTLIGGVVLCMLGLLAFTRNHRKADAESAAAPDLSRM
jgi:heme/copper-type cytochrome/quinol oxidase subunit 1